MPPLTLTTGNYGRPRVDLPQIRQVNAYTEVSTGGPTGGIRTSRPGLTRTFEVGTGPILRSYQNPGLFGGDVFTISGSEVYRNTTKIGDVGFSKNPRMAAANSQLAIVSGGALYYYDGATFSQVQFFYQTRDRLPLFSGVIVLFDIFCYPVIGSDEFFYSNTGSANQITADQFSAAQTSPDTIVEGIVLAEEILWLGDTSGEWWDFNPQTNAQGQVLAPFALSQGRTYIRGCSSQASVCKLDNSVFWAADDFSVYRSSSVPIKVSTPFIDDRLKKAGKSGQVSAFTFNLEGHVFYVINLPTLGVAGESYAYDCQTKEWAAWGTNTPVTPDPGVFLGLSCTGQGDTVWIGSRVDGQVYLADVNSHLDGTIPMQVVVSGAQWLGEGRQRCANVTLHCVRGVGSKTVPDPIVQMRYSDDGARSWSSWKTGRLGMRGQFGLKATWRGLPEMKQPGRVFEFRVSDAVNVTIEGAAFNVARP